MKSVFTDLRREALICARCGYCQPVCPAYAELGWESAGPRGRMAVALDCAAGRPITPEQARRVFECTLCGRCREACPTRIETGEVWHEYVLSLMSQPPVGKGSMHCEETGVQPRSINGWQSFVSVAPAQV